MCVTLPGQAFDESDSLKISRQNWRLILEQVQNLSPEEACGMLSGRSGVVTHVYPIENELHSPSSFRMNPSAQYAAMLAIETDQEDIIGIYHSHPGGPDEPSETDLRDFAYPGARYVILYPHQGNWMGRCFNLDIEPYMPVTLLIDEQDATL